MPVHLSRCAGEVETRRGEGEGRIARRASPLTRVAARRTPVRCAAQPRIAGEVYSMP
jgi:hypothetical protein